jgi:hypothetical protein
MERRYTFHEAVAAAEAVHSCAYGEHAGIQARHCVWIGSSPAYGKHIVSVEGCALEEGSSPCVRGALLLTCFVPAVNAVIHELKAASAPA